MSEKVNNTILLYDNPFNTFNNRFLNHVILHEECGELIQASCKVARFGPDEYNPNDPKHITNRQKLVKEMGDVLALIDIICDDPILKIAPEELKQQKFAKFRKLLDYYTFAEKPKRTIVPEEEFRSCQQSAEIADEYDRS